MIDSISCPWILISISLYSRYPHALCSAPITVENGGSVEKNLKYVTKLNLRLRERIKEIPGVHINSPENALPYIINISIDEIPSQVSVNFFSMNGVYISAGSACSKGHRSNVLQSMGLPPDRIDSAIRISLSNDTSIDEIDRCADVIKIAVEKLRKHKIKTNDENNTKHHKHTIHKHKYTYSYVSYWR